MDNTILLTIYLNQTNLGKSTQGDLENMGEYL